MDSMEDSGIESDPKPTYNNTVESKVDTRNGGTSEVLKVARKTELQRKLEKQREHNRKSQNEPVYSQPRKSGFLARNKLAVPEKHERGYTKVNLEESEHLLVHIPTDESDDEFEMPISISTNREITEQLIKDGYNLDLAPDDEDLDLIPPRPINEQCVCCTAYRTCSIQ